MHRRVVPPTIFEGRMPEDLPHANQIDREEGYTGVMDYGSYTDLLVNGVEETLDPRPTRATAKSSQGRSKNFRDEEDILLVIEARNHSGWSVDDKIANACAMFKAEDPKDRKFSYLHCWKILKDKPKWMDRRKEVGSVKKTTNKKQKTMINSSPTSVAPAIVLDGPDDGGVHAEPSARPDGKKKEKQKLRQRSTMEAVDYLMEKKKEADIERELKKEERCNKAFALLEERIKLDKEKFEFQRQLEEDKILGLDLSTMDYKQQQYYEHRQNEILARRFNI
ncbi:hypothetical protein GUJ93_ZPchr0001g31117 [Zizania palustris]|uniref:No apical meristem-associated C-terminal domain-containing protein n=1 Tax=Zizania palustris TaxID=103762 RepID=A0A8J5RUV8_ZIZPA|nr:hypothetical protein GUJ93_ZPchr0001g31117 [Zizania palustris]